MPRAVTKTIGSKKPAPKKAQGKKKNGYEMPESIPLGEILTDLSKKRWKIGPSIGVGGFGEIYSACEVDKALKKFDDYEYVVKIEPHGNGPLFVEMHFYMRNAKLEDIKNFANKRGLKSIGMPHLLGSGSHEINNVKHRFIVMPRYSRDIWSYFLKNGKKLPEHTIYRLALQMLDIYDYIHGGTYVHGDLKGANILLGFGKGGSHQAYLVDFGLASHYTTKDFKPDPKKMHNGTIEYTSRDAHLGVPTMRGDFEILGYNLIHWSGVTLPWEAENLLADPVKVQKSKENFMLKIDESLQKLYGKNIPDPIKQFMSHIKNLEFNEQPDYEKCRKIFQGGLKTLGKTNTGDLELDFKQIPSTSKAINKSIEKSSPIKKTKGTVKKKYIDSEDESNGEIVEVSPEVMPRKRRTPLRNRNESPTKRKNHSPEKKGTPKRTKTESPEKKFKVSPKINLNLKGSSTPILSGRQGKTIINDNLTPNPGSKKTYEFNFELDVSLDANVVVNIKRKKKEKASAGKKTETPEPRVRVRRVTPSPNSVKTRNSK